jgi:putative holliday junction resolvase
MPEAAQAPPGASSPAKSVETVLAFDFGLRRIGIAVGDTLTASAAPRPAAFTRRTGPDWRAIAREIDALKPRRLVVGAPYNADGTPGALAPAARRFADELERRFKLPVNMVDERWSSLEAGAALKARRAGGGRRRIRREHVDSAAAAVILERWLAGESGEPLK